MNFLPFVFTFLLLLTLISSFLFSSVLGMNRETKIILSQHRAYLTLLSKQNLALFKTKKEPDAKNTQKPAPPKNAPLKKSSKEPRTEKTGLEASKLNLYKLIHGNNPQAERQLEHIAIRLIENLYGSCKFYQSSSVKGIAQTIVKKMREQQIETFEELDLEKENLDEIYYKMLKGTNTGYPSLTEYFRICEKDEAPIYFRYASRPVLEALLGKESAHALFDLEKKKWLQNKKYKLLTKKEFEELLNAQHAPVTPLNLISFDNKVKKGPAQIHQDKAEKIRAMHKVETF